MTNAIANDFATVCDCCLLDMQIEFDATSALESLNNFLFLLSLIPL